MDGALKRLFLIWQKRKAVMTTGNKYSSWFKPVNFDFEKAKQETFIEGVKPLEGQTLRDRFVEMYSVQHFFNPQGFCDGA